MGPPGKPACVNSLNTFGNHVCFTALSFRMGKFCGTGAATFTMAGMLYRTPFPTLGQYFTVVSKAVKTEVVI